MKEESLRYFEKAAECIEDSSLLLKSNRFAAALNRAYYAMLHAATAILLENDIKRKSHHGTISAFGQFFVKQDKISKDLFQSFRQAFELRLQSDYGVEHEVNAKEAKDVVNKAMDFVGTCKSLCD